MTELTVEEDDCGAELFKKMTRWKQREWHITWRRRVIWMTIILNKNTLLLLRVHVDTYMSRHIRGGQGTTLWRWSSPSTSMWVQGILCNDVMISGHQACIHVLYLLTYLSLTAIRHLREMVQKEPCCMLRALKRTIHWPCVPSGVTEEERCSRWRKQISFAPTYQSLPTGDPPDRRTVETMAWGISKQGSSE